MQDAIVTLVVFLSLAVVFFYSQYRRLQGLSQAQARAFEDLAAYYELRRQGLRQALEAEWRGALDDKAFNAIEKALSGAASERKMAARLEAERQIDQAAALLLAADAKGNLAFSAWQTRLRDVEGKLTVMRKFFDNARLDYQKAANQFTGKLLAKFMEKLLSPVAVITTISINDAIFSLSLSCLLLH